MAYNKFFEKILLLSERFSRIFIARFQSHFINKFHQVSRNSTKNNLRVI